MMLRGYRGDPEEEWRGDTAQDRNDPPFRANRQITARSIRLIDDHGTATAVMPLARALTLAGRHGDDPVAVGPFYQPPACRLMPQSLDDR